MNSSGDFGVVVFSMGASFDAAFAHSLLPNLFQAFSRLPQKVLMKIRPSHFTNASAPPNVKFTHWFPQQDILGKNSKVIIPPLFLSVELHVPERSTFRTY